VASPKNKEQAILEAAGRLFARRGFPVTSMKDIAAEAGIAVGTTYLYHPTKDDLLAALYRHSSALLLERIERRLAGTTGAWSKLEAFLAESIEFSFAHPDFFLLVFVDLRRSEIEFPQRTVYVSYHKYIDRFKEILAEGRRSGEFAIPDSSKFVMGFMGFWVAMLLRSVLEPAIPDPAAEKAEILNLVRQTAARMVLAPAAANKEGS